jgi:hypothetical protein
MQLAAHARFEGLVAGTLRGARRDRRRILRMEVAAPVDMVAQEFDDEFLQQRVVLAVRTEEAGVERVAIDRVGGRLHQVARERQWQAHADVRVCLVGAA